MSKDIIEHIKDIKYVDNFFPKIIEKQINSFVFQKDQKWDYQPWVSYPKGKNKPHALPVLWSKNNKIEDSEAFVMPIDNDHEFANFLFPNIKTSAKEKFNITNVKIVRCMFTYLPANSDYKEDYIMPPHVDQFYPHRNILYYINDNDAETNFYDLYHDDEKPHDFPKLTKLYGMKPKQGRAITFDGGIYHSASVSRLRKRLTLNITLMDDGIKK